MEDKVYESIVKRPRPSLMAAGAFVLLAAAGLWLASLAVDALAPRLWPAGADFVALEALLDGLYYLPFMALPVALYMIHRKGLFDAMRLNPLPAGTTLLLIPMAVMSVYVADGLSVAWTLLLEGIGLRYNVSVPIPQNSRELTLAILLMAAAPAVCEELLFRGLVLSAWESRGTALAIGLSGALFALLHGNIFGLPVYLGLGLLMGYLVYALDSVYAGIVFHTVYNTACLVIPYLLAPMAEQAEEAMPTGAALMASAALDMLLTTGMVALLVNVVRMRSRLAGIRPIPRVRRPLSGGEKAMMIVLAAALLALNAITAMEFAGGGA